MNQSHSASVREHSRSLRERSNGLRSDSKQLREAVSKIHALVASVIQKETASPSNALNPSRPAMPLNSLDFDKVRKAREQAKTTRERASELRREAEVFRSLARKARREPAQPT